MRRIVCVLNMTGNPSKRIHTYCLRLCPLNVLFFCSWRRNRSTIDHGVGVVVGVKAISLVPLFCWADTISYFLSHKFHIIDSNAIFSLSCCGCCCCCFFIIIFVLFFLSVLLVSSFIVVSSICFAIKNYIPHNNIITYCSTVSTITH